MEIFGNLLIVLEKPKAEILISEAKQALWTPSGTQIFKSALKEQSLLTTKHQIFNTTNYLI